MAIIVILYTILKIFNHQKVTMKMPQLILFAIIWGAPLQSMYWIKDLGTISSLIQSIPSEIGKSIVDGCNTSIVENKLANSHDPLELLIHKYSSKADLELKKNLKYNVHSADSKGYPIIYLAVKNGLPSTVEELLKRGASPCRKLIGKENTDMDPFYIAVYSRKLEIALILAAYGAYTQEDKVRVNNIITYYRDDSLHKSSFEYTLKVAQLCSLFFDQHIEIPATLSNKKSAMAMHMLRKREKTVIGLLPRRLLNYILGFAEISNPDHRRYFSISEEVLKEKDTILAEHSTAKKSLPNQIESALNSFPTEKRLTSLSKEKCTKILNILGINADNLLQGATFEVKDLAPLQIVRDKKETSILNPSDISAIAPYDYEDDL